ncbi:MAG: hypothetical protein HN348_25515 [Proteobacteria bacterium]|jgi:hypothetical protein|nr:hypothetical protein [Pseudomonadota bacterium]
MSWGLFLSLGMAFADTDEATFLLDLPLARVEVTDFVIANPRAVVGENAQRMCTFSVVADQGDAKAISKACPPDLREKVDITRWQFAFSSTVPAEVELMRVSYLFPTATDPRSAVFLSPGRQVLQMVAPDGLIRELDKCHEWSWVVGGYIRPSGEYTEPPSVLCTIDLKVDWFGVTTVVGVSDCPENMHDKAIEQAMRSNRYCPRWVDGVPVEYRPSFKERVEFSSTPDVSDYFDTTDGRLLLRDSIAIEPNP